ncbi:ribonuclease [Parasphingopyxis sp. CP4]|uniref:ribonuclease E/G n=1 Tax=Parasphingopyxis sp. CP4 TaxID=2724527 RepID=UPI0015A3F66F|nr:ribonuclease E/G [Parasphingopyxis sp. CP4]QLC22401.1 ribonuclease [Parasphingopyxis sp. CP4]
MTEWLYEAGIGEARAALVDNGEIIEAHIEPEEDGVRAGMVCEAQLSDILPGNRVGRVMLEDGTNGLLEPIPTGTTEGATILVEISRSAIPEPGKIKGPRTRPAAKGRTARPAPTLHDRIAKTNCPIKTLLNPGEDPLEDAGWSELIEQAATGAVPFSGGALRIALTPAMTVIDVDGALPPAELAIAGARASAEAIRRLDIGGATVIDLPSLSAKTDRQAAADAFDAALHHPFERTSVNGFGLLQIVRKRTRPSLLEYAQYDAVSTAARALLRRAERVTGVGPLTLTVHPDIAARLASQPDWIATLERRIGTGIEIKADVTIALWAGHASNPHPG